MVAIADAFSRTRAENRPAFMPYIMAGDPDLAATLRICRGLAEAGADLIELGVPFSDPIADGPVNQRAAQRALAAGTSLCAILSLMERLRKHLSLPILLMGYSNPFYRYGFDRLARDAAAAGASGLIIPDLPAEAAAELRESARRHGLSTVFLIAPTSTAERLRLTAKASEGFVYAVSLTGVTGIRRHLPSGLARFLRLARHWIDLPLAVGFGIGSPAMAAAVGRLADGVVVGSAIVQKIEAAVAAGREPAAAVRPFAARFSAALRRCRR